MASRPNRRILFRTVSGVAKPVGGAKVIFQSAALLAERGWQAVVATASGLPGWLASDALARRAPIIDTGNGVTLRGSDVLVLPERATGPELDRLIGSGLEVIVYCQGHLNLLRNRRLVETLRTRWQLATVSKTGARVLAERIGREPPVVISPPVDGRVFRPGEKVPFTVAAMPAKWPEVFAEIRKRVAATAFGDRVRWRVIDGLGTAAVAEVLSTSALFLSLSRAEGFGLPPLEAMSAGCLVAGFAGHGMSDYAGPENGIWCREGDVDALLACLTAAVELVSGHPAEAERMIASGRATAARYSVEGFADAWDRYLLGLLAVS
jgi:hypothetical protein